MISRHRHPAALHLEAGGACGFVRGRSSKYCLGTRSIQAEKSRPNQKVLGLATLATRAVASIGLAPGL